MANKLLGYPCTLAVNVTSGSYTTIAAVLDIDTQVETAAQDFASRDSNNNREYTGGLRDGGECTFDLLYDPDDATHDASLGLVALALARTVKHWRLTLGDTAPATQWNFAGFIKAFKPKTPLNGALRASVVIKTTWTPAVTAADAPLASDGFGGAFGVTDGLGGGGTGGDGVVWTHNTYSTSGGKAINTPGVGAELLTNTTFDADTANWTAVNATLSSVAGGQSGNALEVKSTTSTGGNAYAYQGVAGPVAGDWLLAQIYHKNGTQTGSMRLASTSSGADIKALTVQSDSTWAQKALSGMALSASTYLRLSVATGVLNDTTLYDTVSLKKLNLVDLFATVDVIVADVAVEVALTVPAGLDAGLILNLDSPISPANWVQVHVNRSGGVVTAVKVVAGAPTVLFSTAIIYVSGAVLKVTKSGTSYHVDYNGASVNTATVNDAGIIHNAQHGLFIPHPTVTFDNFVVYAN